MFRSVSQSDKQTAPPLLRHKTGLHTSHEKIHGNSLVLQKCVFIFQEMLHHFILEIILEMDSFI